MKEIIKNAMILFAITLVASVLLAYVYSITKEPIAEVQIVNRDKALASVLPNADFEELTDLDFTDYDKIDTLFVALNGAETVGYAFKLVTTEGYGGPIDLVVAIDISGMITGLDIIQQSETPGLGAKVDLPEFKDQFAGIKAEELTVVKGGAVNPDEIDAISSSTITSNAVTGAINQAIAYYQVELNKEGK